jgi:hypothetical protein
LREQPPEFGTYIAVDNALSARRGQFRIASWVHVAL